MATAVVLEIGGEIDRGHTASAEFPLDAITVGESLHEAYPGRAFRYSGLFPPSGLGVGFPGCPTRPNASPPHSTDAIASNAS